MRVRRVDTASEQDQPRLLKAREAVAEAAADEPVRTQVRNVYALVRVADEIVDNPDPSLGSEPRARSGP